MMKNSFALACAASVLITLGVIPARAADGARTYPIVDPVWRMVAGTVRVPAGWGFAGVVIHADIHNCALSGEQLRVAVASRDGLTGYDLLPVVKSEWVNDPQIVAQMRQVGCPVSQSLHAADYIRQVVIPNVHPGARVVSVSPEPEMAALVEQHRRADEMMQRQTGGGPQRVYEAVRVVIAYTLRGHEVEEAISTVTSCARTEAGGVAGIARIDDISCIGGPTLLRRAPADRFAAFLNDRSLINLALNAQWQQRVEQQKQVDAQQINQETLAEIQRNREKSQQFQQQTIANAQRNVALIQSIGAASRSAAAQKQAAIDHSAGAFSAHMGDYNDYTNPETGKTTRLSNQYGSAYQDDAFPSAGGGAIQLTNATQSPGAAWVQLIPKY